MSYPFIICQLSAKAAELEGLSGRLANAQSDLIHVPATLRMFDPYPEDAKPSKSYYRGHAGSARNDLFDHCKAALRAADEPLSTRELARAVILAEGWDPDDCEPHLTTAHGSAT